MNSRVRFYQFVAWNRHIFLFITISIFYLWAFHISATWWSFTRVWTTASLLKSPGVFLVFWSISIMQLFGQSLLVLLFPSPPVPLLIHWWLYQVHQSQLVKTPLSCSIVFFSIPKKGLGIYPSFHLLSILICGQLEKQSSQFCKLLIIIRSGRLAEIRWSVCIPISWWSLRVSFSMTDSGLCMYHLFLWSNFNFLHNSQWIILLTQSCLFLYSFCANLLHSLIMWLTVSSLSPHSLHLLFCRVLSILALIWLVLIALFRTAIRSDSVSIIISSNIISISIIIISSSCSSSGCSFIIIVIIIINEIPCLW